MADQPQEMSDRQLLKKIAKNQNALHNRLTTMEQRIYRFTDDVGEVSKRGQAVFEDVFKIVLSFTFDAALGTDEDQFVTASDFHFDYLKVVAHPADFSQRFGIRIKDLSSDVEIVSGNDFLPVDSFTGTGQLPFAEVAPRRFVARGGLTVAAQDNGTVDGIVPANPGDFPYTVRVTFHGLKVFLQRVERQGQ